jgi:hypothetical protein
MTAWARFALPTLRSLRSPFASPTLRRYGVGGAARCRRRAPKEVRGEDDAQSGSVLGGTHVPRRRLGGGVVREALSQRRRRRFRQPAAAASARRLGARQARYGHGARASEGSDAGTPRADPSRYRAVGLSLCRRGVRSDLYQRAFSAGRSLLRQGARRFRRRRRADQAGLQALAAVPGQCRSQGSGEHCRRLAEPDLSERPRHVRRRSGVPARHDGAGEEARAV